MIGNSLKSDILPVLELRAFGFHIPYHTTWQYEMVDVSVEEPRLLSHDSWFGRLTHLRFGSR